MIKLTKKLFVGDLLVAPCWISSGYWVVRRGNVDALSGAAVASEELSKDKYGIRHWREMKDENVINVLPSNLGELKKWTLTGLYHKGTQKYGMVYECALYRSTDGGWAGLRRIYVEGLQIPLDIYGDRADRVFVWNSEGGKVEAVEHVTGAIMPVDIRDVLQLAYLVLPATKVD